jgi:hypothetical protein
MSDQKKPFSMKEKRDALEARLAKLREQKQELIEAMRKRDVQDAGTFTRLAGVGVLNLLAETPNSVNVETLRAAIRAAALKRHEKRALAQFGPRFGISEDGSSVPSQDVPIPPDIMFRDSGDGA